MHRTITALRPARPAPRARRPRVCPAAVALVALLLPAALAWADGKFYYGDGIARGVSFQRAILFHDGATETLVVQSRFAGAPTDVGWVVPTPARPEVAVWSEEGSYYGFRELAGWTRSRVIHLDLNARLVLLAAGVLILVARAGLDSARSPGRARPARDRGRLRRRLQIGYLAGLVALVAVAVLDAATAVALLPVYVCVGFALYAAFGRPWRAAAAVLLLAVVVAQGIPAYQSYDTRVLASGDAGPYRFHVVDARSAEASSPGSAIEASRSARPTSASSAVTWSGAGTS